MIFYLHPELRILKKHSRHYRVHDSFFNFLLEVCKRVMGGFPSVKLGDLNEYSSRALQNNSYALEYLFSEGSR